MASTPVEDGMNLSATENAPNGAADQAAPLSDMEAGTDDRPFRDRRLAIIIGALFFVLFLGWAAFTPLDSGAYAQGQIEVSGNRQAVQHREGGIVAKIHVTEGELVRKGQVLVEISSPETEASERAMSAEIYTLMAQRERLLAEADGRGSVRQPPEFATIPEKDRQLAMAALEQQRRLYVARGSSIGAQQGVLEKREAQFDDQIAGLKMQMAANREQRRLIGEEIAGMKELAEKGFASLNRIRALERTAAGLDGEYGASQAAVARARESIGEVSMQSVSLGRGVIEDASTQLRDVMVRLNELIPQVGALRRQLANAHVRAPSAGKVVGTKVFTVGGVVPAGELLMEIVPVDKELVIQAIVEPRHADDIHIGQLAQVRFPAIEDRAFPTLEGLVAKRSADSFTDDRTGQKYFRIEVHVPEKQMRIAGVANRAREFLQPGLPAEILITLRKRSVLDYLIEPLTHTLWLAGRED